MKHIPAIDDVLGVGGLATLGAGVYLLAGLGLALAVVGAILLVAAVALGNARRGA